MPPRSTTGLRCYRLSVIYIVCEHTVRYVRRGVQTPPPTASTAPRVSAASLAHMPTEPPIWTRGECKMRVFQAKVELPRVNSIPPHAEWEFYQLWPIEERLQASHLLPHLAGTALLTNYTCVRLLVLALIPLSVKVNQHPFLKQDGSFTANIFKSCRWICVYVYVHIYSCRPT